MSSGDEMYAKVVFGSEERQKEMEDFVLSTVLGALGKPARMGEMSGLFKTFLKVFIDEHLAENYKAKQKGEKNE